jgi:hypothetical protein
MASLDVLQLARATADSTSPSVTFSSVAPGDLLVFLVAYRIGSATITPPAGLTAYTGRAGWPYLATYARVVQAGDTATWTFSLSTGSHWATHGYRIEGPFTNLTGVQITDDSTFASNTSQKILLTDASVGNNTLVIASITKYSNTAFSFGNSFTDTTNDAIGPEISLGTARRLYASSSTTVASTATWTGATSGTTALIRIAQPAGGGGPTPAQRARYRKRCNLTK